MSALAQHFLLNANDDLAMDMEAWLKEDANPKSEEKALAHQAK